MRLLALAMILCLLPTVQGLSLEAMAPDLPPLAIDEAAPAQVTVQLRCDAATDPIHSAPRYLAHAITTEYDGLLPSEPSRTPLPDDHCISGDQLAMTVPFSLLGDRTVPGAVPLTAIHEFQVQDEAGEAVSEVLFVEQPLTMTWYGNISIQTSSSTKMAGPQKQLTYDIHVVNHGNARTTVHWEVLGGDDLEGTVVVPAPVILDVPGTNGAAAAAQAIYSTPFQNGPNRAAEAFTIIGIPTDTMDGGMQGDPVAIELLAHTKGMYVPGPTALLPIVLALAFLARRR